jgi:ATP-binding cassette, subfamily G (WHITE), member 1
LGLAQKSNHFTGDLSGGEQKRLSIALEIIDNPSILYLDEPTTGLDSVSSVQCIKLLKKLAREDRTIVCTIHTPSALMLEIFDHLYALADGCCIYQGSVMHIVTFLKELDLACPSNYNPSDFLTEIANNEYGIHNERLTESIGNGTNENFRTTIEYTLTSHKSLDLLLDCNLTTDIPTNFFDELRQLLVRNFLITTRDKCLTLLRLAIHFIVAVFIGLMYFGIGNDGANIFNIYKLLFFNIFILMFTAFSSLQTSCKIHCFHAVIERILTIVFNSPVRFADNKKGTLQWMVRSLSLLRSSHNS